MEVFGVLDKKQVLGDDWPPVEEALFLLKEGYQMDLMKESMEAKMDELEKEHHLAKYCWAFELRVERYEHARFLGRSPESIAEDLPKTSEHWDESTAAGFDKLLEEPLRVHAHACLRFSRQMSLRWTHELLFESCSQVVSDGVNARKRKQAVFTKMG